MTSPLVPGSRGPQGGAGGPSGPRRGPLNPSTALRIAILGGTALVLFGVLIARLWFLQVIGGQAYAKQAEDNRIRVVKEQAPRGLITDRTGKVVLAQNRPGWDVVAHPLELMPPRRLGVLKKLQPVLKVSLAGMRRKMTYAQHNTPYDGVVLASDVDRDVQIAFAEHAREFPGVSLERSYVRTYPEGVLGAHVLGYTGRITDTTLAQYRKRGYVGNETIGVSGVEYEYESYLKGEKGERRVEVDAAGDPVGRGTVSASPAVSGDTLKLSIDVPTQKALEAQLAFRVNDSPTADGAAGVALDPKTGQVLAMASYPTYQPEAYVAGKDGLVNRYLHDARNPMLGRAWQGMYPPGSTFKAVTLTSALQLGLVGPGQALPSPSKLTLYKTEFHNFRDEYYPDLTPPEAMEVSSDTVFYRLGASFYERYRKDGVQVQQAWARKFGFGGQTGVDLPGENPGRVPTSDYKKTHFASDLDNNYWKPGDDINMSIGQGYFEATPLQMAVAYAAIANGGTVLTPSVAQEITSPTGQVVRRPAAALPRRNLNLSATTLNTVREGLYRAALGGMGTAREVFQPVLAQDQIAIVGKTGTAENPPKTDHSWFVAYGPYTDPKIVVAIVVEHGGTGATAAAPAVCRTMAAYLKFDPEHCGRATAKESN